MVKNWDCCLVKETTLKSSQKSMSITIGLERKHFILSCVVEQIVIHKLKIEISKALTVGLLAYKLRITLEIIIQSNP